MAIDVKIYPDKDWDLNNWTDDNEDELEIVKTKIDRVILLFKEEQYWFDDDEFKGVDWNFIINNKEVLNSNNTSKIALFLTNIKNDITNALADLPFFVRIKDIDIVKENNVLQLQISFEGNFNGEKIEEYKRNYAI